MSTDAQHPEWLSIGSHVEIVRRLGRSVASRRGAVVLRHTKTSVVVARGGATFRFRPKWGGYFLSPAYLDYVTELRPAPPDTVDD